MDTQEPDRSDDQSAKPWSLLQLLACTAAPHALLVVEVLTWRAYGSFPWSHVDQAAPSPLLAVLVGLLIVAQGVSNRRALLVLPVVAAFVPHYLFWGKTLEWWPG